VLGTALPLLACAHAAPKAARTSGDGPSRAEVARTMNELTPRIARCIPAGRSYLQVKLTLDGKAGTVREARVLPETLLVCKGDMNHSDSGASCATGERAVHGDASDDAVVECVRRATVGRASPRFPGTSFHLSFAVHAQTKAD
jgi:hypothetical protein